MGLDITLYRAVKKCSNTEDDSEIFFDRECQDMLNDFKSVIPAEYFHECSEDYLDWEKVGVSDDTHEFCMSEAASDRRSYVKFFVLTHELSPVYINFREAFYNMNTSYIIPDSDIEILNKYGWNDYKYGTLHVSDLKDNTVTTSAEYYLLYNFIDSIISKVIYIDDVPLYKEHGVKLYMKEKGYQRRGATPAFYDNYTDDMEWVLSKDKLRYIYNNYIKEEYKEHFKKNILDPFVNGKHFVHFSW